MTANLDRQRHGKEAEAHAHELLATHGLASITRNWHCRGGELDLVMLDGDTVVFVEVRYRQHRQWGGALESIDARKRQRLVLAAEHFLHRHPQWADHPCRFDVVAVEGDQPSRPGTHWIKNAFDS